MKKKTVEENYISHHLPKLYTVFNMLKECVKIIANILDKVHVTQLFQHQVSGLMGEGHLEEGL